MEHANIINLFFDKLEHLLIDFIFAFIVVIRDRDKEKKRRRSRSRDRDRDRERKREKRERRERERGERLEYIKTDDGGEIRIKEEPLDGKLFLYYNFWLSLTNFYV